MIINFVNELIDFLGDIDSQYDECLTQSQIIYNIIYVDYKNELQNICTKYNKSYLSDELYQLLILLTKED